MTAEEIFARVQRVVVSNLTNSVTPVTLASTFQDLSIDSLDMVMILMELEDEFDVVIVDEEAEKWKSVQDAVTFLEKKLA